MDSKRVVELDMMKFWGILFVVLGHVTNMYFPNGLVHMSEHPKGLMLISSFLYSFHMPLFVFISGAVYSYQYEILGKRYGLKRMISTKAKRLLIPYLFFGFVVMLPLMVGCGFRESFVDYAYHGIFLSKDSRHLWFVLMLFEVFVVFWVMRKMVEIIKLPKWTLLVLSFVLMLVSSKIPYIFQLNMTAKYLFWFAIGYDFMMHKDNYKVFVLGVLFPGMILMLYLIENQHLNVKAPLFATVTAMAGIMLIYSISSNIAEGGNSVVGLVVKSSFGIYLIHVPIIYLMFYGFHTFSISPYLFSLIVFLLSIGISIVLTFGIRKIGLKCLIGE